jgi:hypothetical protein
MDRYLIKWVRCYGLKNCPSKRDIVIDLPRELVYLPTIDPNSSGLDFGVVETRKAFEEYLAKAKNPLQAAVHNRALSGNYQRSRNVLTAHVDYLTGLRLYKAETVKRYLESKVKGSDAGFDRMLDIFGLGSDGEFVSEFAWRVLTILRRHPKNSVTLYMHSQDFPYMAEVVTAPVFRRVPKFRVNGAYASLADGIPTKLKLYDFCSFVEPIQLLVDGFDSGNKVCCKALFHRDSFGPIISLGDPKRGGSILQLDLSS